MYQLLFKKRLTGTQWLSLLVLTAGCVVKEAHKFNGSSLAAVPYYSWALIGVQVRVPLHATAHFCTPLHLLHTVTHCFPSLYC